MKYIGKQKGNIDGYPLNAYDPGYPPGLMADQFEEFKDCKSDTFIAPNYRLWRKQIDGFWAVNKLNLAEWE